MKVPAFTASPRAAATNRRDLPLKGARHEVPRHELHEQRRPRIRSTGTTSARSATRHPRTRMNATSPPVTAPPTNPAIEKSNRQQRCQGQHAAETARKVEVHATETARNSRATGATRELMTKLLPRITIALALAVVSVTATAALAGTSGLRRPSFDRLRRPGRDANHDSTVGQARRETCASR